MGTHGSEIICFLIHFFPKLSFSRSLNYINFFVCVCVCVCMLDGAKVILQFIWKIIQ